MIGRLACALLAAQMSWADTGLESLDLRQDTLGYEGVGRLDIDDSGYCTGVLIEPDIVLTAAHCLYDEDTRIDPRSLTFKAGLRHGEAVATRQVRRAVIKRGYRRDDADQVRQLENDIAIVQLETAIPWSTAAPFRVSSGVGVGDTVSVVSYARGRSETLSLQEQCKVTGQQDKAIGLSCDTDHGSSGAPVFRHATDQDVIVSIISRGARSAQTHRVFGMLVAEAVDEMQEDLALGRGVFPQDIVEGRTVRAGDKRAAGGARFVRP